jgi:hypothetical protein
MFEKTSIKNNKTLFAIALTALLAISACAAFVPTISAHTPAWTIPTTAYITAAPNPVGIGQQVLLVF